MIESAGAHLTKKLVWVYVYACERCSHEWEPRTPSPPKVCPRCKSPYWDRPRRSALNAGNSKPPA